MKRKRQHYVPQHYLREFRVAGTSQVMAFRIDPPKFIGRAAINRQCQQDYFYGEDGSLEDLLSDSETDLAPVLVRVSQRKQFTSEEQVALRWLAVVMHLRTRKAAEAAKVFPRMMAYEVITHGIATGRLPAPEGGYKLEMMDFGGVPGQLIKQAIPSWLEMQTLHCTLLEAESGHDFITSDNPAILMNQYFAHLEPHRSYAGFSRSGFQLLMPLSPRLCVFFYDLKVYTAGSRRSRLVKIKRKDVEIINSLQVLAAEHCLYFHEASLESYVAHLVTRYAGYRIPVEETMRELKGRNENETIIHQRNQSVILPKLWNFCRPRQDARIGPDRRRDPHWSALVKAVMKDMEENKSGESVMERMKRILGDEI